jgi:hypothetical protein
MTDGASPSGRAADFDSAIPGSSPGAPAMEEWRAVPKWEGYEASSLGRIRRLACVNPSGNRRLKERILEANPVGGYCGVVIGWPKRRMYVHRMVLLAFRGDPPAGQPHCRHLDGNKQNNRLSNLAWGSPHENALDREKHGTQAKPSAKLNEFKVRCILALLAQAATQYKIASLFGLKQSSVNDIARGRTWRSVPRPEIIRVRRRRKP